MEYPLVSIIIPSYNHAQYIDQAIQSVFDQTYENIELIVVDDGSIDNTHEVLEKYIGQENIRIYLNKKNRGQSVVLNEAINKAKGDFISFLPSDDWYLPQKTKLQVEKFRAVSKKVGAVYGTGMRFFEDTGKKKEITIKKYRGDILRQLITEPFCIYPITPLFRKECFEKVRFDESYRAEGEGIFLKIAIYYNYDYIDEPVGVMRDHSYNVGKNVDLMYEENLRWWSEFFEIPDLQDEISNLKNVGLGFLKRLKGIEKIVINHDNSMGRRLLVESVKLIPRYVFDKKIILAYLLSLLPKQLSKKVLGSYYKKK